MDDLKVGDIVRLDRFSSVVGTPQGVITKIETKIRPTPRTYAVVFWFRSRQRRAVNVVWLTKVEDRGV